MRATRGARLFIVMTGLPASGKTTLGLAIANELMLPILDKDAVLEALFDACGVSTQQDRLRLSRESDHVLEAAARESDGAVIASFWRRDDTSITSGTPTEWLSDLPDATLVEVVCQCSPAVAADRFRARVRHPGHFDAGVDPNELLSGYELLAEAGPVTDGAVVRVDTEGRVDVPAVCAEIRGRLHG
jgi:predicted kinase